MRPAIVSYVMSSLSGASALLTLEMSMTTFCQRCPVKERINASRSVAEWAPPFIFGYAASFIARFTSGGVASSFNSATA